ncbi:LOW QUALITY PROTEIN: mRNA-decapping enzyme 1A [Rhinophrynus dorsalis]
MAARGKVGQEMSLAALRQTDPYISNIVDVTGQVALYSFSAKANEWEKTDIEGTLFVYKRSASPLHGFTIMNRLNMHNLVEPVNKDLEFQLHEPFLLYRNGNLSIYSIWFYDRNDCQRIAKLMTEVVQEECERVKNRKSPSITNGPNARTIDILEMLSKAKNEYEKGHVISDGGNDSDAPRNATLSKADSLEVSEISSSTPQDKSFQVGQKHLTVEELFGTSLPKEQPAPMNSSPELRERRMSDLGGHNVFLPFSCDQSKPVQPVVVKADCATFNSVASDFGRSTCVYQQGPSSQKAGNFPIRLSPGLGLTPTSEVLSSSVPLGSSNPTSMIPVMQSAVRQVSPIMSQSLLDFNSGAQNCQLIPPLVPISASNMPNESHPSVDLLQRLKLASPSGQTQTQPISKAIMAPKFNSTLNQLATPESFKGSLTKTTPSSSLTMAPLQNVHERRDCESVAQPKSLSKVVAAPHFIAPTTTVAPSVLLSPSVFEQSVQKSTVQEDKARTSPSDLVQSNTSTMILNRSQLQETLVHLIKNDSSFINTVHEVYLQVLNKSLENVKL